MNICWTSDLALTPQLLVGNEPLRSGQRRDPAHCFQLTETFLHASLAY